MTAPLDLSAIQARAERAAFPNLGDADTYTVNLVTAVKICREDIPALVAALRAMRQALAGLRSYASGKVGIENSASDIIQGNELLIDADAALALVRDG